MAESGSWPSIQKQGLLSTSALLDLFEVEGEERFAIESQWRPQSVVITHPTHGTAVIRDQKPLHEGALAKLLDGMSTREYFELLNGKTFFWVRSERLERLLNARAYRSRRHIVLTVDSKQLVTSNAGRLWLSPINSGAIFGSGRRGVQTFKGISEYPFEDMKKRKGRDAIVELAVDYAVKNISDLTAKVEEWEAGTPVQTIWPVD